MSVPWLLVSLPATLAVINIYIAFREGEKARRAGRLIEAPSHLCWPIFIPFRVVWTLLQASSPHRFLFVLGEWVGDRMGNCPPRAAVDLYNELRLFSSTRLLLPPKNSEERLAPILRDFIFVAEIGICLYVLFYIDKPAPIWTLVLLWFLLAKMAHITSAVFWSARQPDLWAVERNLLLSCFQYVTVILMFACFYQYLARTGEPFHGVCPNEAPHVALYYSVVTMTTLGYGDTYPLGMWGRICVTIQPLMGIWILVYSLQTYLAHLKGPRAT